jgi:hypothetical protein
LAERKTGVFALEEIEDEVGHSQATFVLVNDVLQIETYSFRKNSYFVSLNYYFFMSKV